MARVLRMTRGKTSLAREIHCCFHFFCPTSIIYCAEHVYTYTRLTAYRLYMNYRCCQITQQENIFTQIRSCTKCWLDIYRWGAGLAVTGPIRDIGQNVVQSAFETESGSSPPSYCLILFFTAFLEEAFIRNIMCLSCALAAAIAQSV